MKSYPRVAISSNARLRPWPGTRFFPMLSSPLYVLRASEGGKLVVSGGGNVLSGKYDGPRIWCEDIPGLGEDAEDPGPLTIVLWM